MSKLYAWYDKLPEPKRFLTFFIPVSVLLVGCSVGNQGVTLISWLTLMFLLASRMWYLHR